MKCSYGKKKCSLINIVYTMYINRNEIKIYAVFLSARFFAERKEILFSFRGQKMDVFFMENEKNANVFESRCSVKCHKG